MRMRVDHLQYIIKMDEPHKYYSMNEAIPKEYIFYDSIFKKYKSRQS